MPIESEKAAKAAEIIRQFMFGALATKVMPSLPILDDAMECEVRLRLVHALAKHYSIDFPSKHVRDLLEELVGIGASGMAIKLVQDVIAPNGKGEQIRLEAKAFLGGSVKEGAQEIISRIIKTTIPGARLVLDAGEFVETPATLYAVGRVFVHHFEAGGTLQDFEPTLAKEQFEREMLIGQKVVELIAMNKQP
jgi:hypothetical protein